MAYQLSELMSTIKSRVKEPSFDSSLLTSYIQDIQDEILGHKRYKFMETEYEDTLSVNDVTYEPDWDYQALLEIKLVDPNGQVIEPTYFPYDEFFRVYRDVESTIAGQMSAFTDFGGVLYWNRPLGSTYTLKLKYIRKPIKLVNPSDVPDIPEEYKNIIIRGAMASIEEYRENWDIAAIHRRKAEELAEDMSVRYMIRQFMTSSKSKMNVNRTRYNPVEPTWFR